MPSHDRIRRRELWRKQARQRQAENDHVLGRIDALRAAAMASVKVVYDREAGIGEIPGYLIERMRGGAGDVSRVRSPGRVLRAL